MGELLAGLRVGTPVVLVPHEDDFAGRPVDRLEHEGPGRRPETVLPVVDEVGAGDLVLGNDPAKQLTGIGARVPQAVFERLRPGHDRAGKDLLVSEAVPDVCDAGCVARQVDRDVVQRWIGHECVGEGEVVTGDGCAVRPDGRGVDLVAHGEGAVVVRDEAAVLL